MTKCIYCGKDCGDGVPICTACFKLNRPICKYNVIKNGRWGCTKGGLDDMETPCFGLAECCNKYCPLEGTSKSSETCIHESYNDTTQSYNCSVMPKDLGLPNDPYLCLHDKSHQKCNAYKKCFNVPKKEIVKQEIPEDPKCIYCGSSTGIRNSILLCRTCFNNKKIICLYNYYDTDSKTFKCRINCAIVDSKDPCWGNLTRCSSAKQLDKPLTQTCKWEECLKNGKYNCLYPANAIASIYRSSKDYFLHTNKSEKCDPSKCCFNFHEDESLLKKPLNPAICQHQTRRGDVYGCISQQGWLNTHNKYADFTKLCPPGMSCFNKKQSPPSIPKEVFEYLAKEYKYECPHNYKVGAHYYCDHPEGCINEKDWMFSDPQGNRCSHNSCYYVIFEKCKTYQKEHPQKEGKLMEEKKGIRKCGKCNADIREGSFCSRCGAAVVKTQFKLEPPPEVALTYDESERKKAIKDFKCRKKVFHRNCLSCKYIQKYFQIFDTDDDFMPERKYRCTRYGGYTIYFPFDFRCKDWVNLKLIECPTCRYLIKPQRKCPVCASELNSQTAPGKLKRILLRILIYMTCVAIGYFGTDVIFKWLIHT